MLTDFAAHGSCTVVAEGQILVTRVTGPWNLELVEQWATAATAAAAILAQSGPWAGLFMAYKSALSTRDAVSALGKSIRAILVESHPLANVYVIAPGVEGHGMVETGLERMQRGIVPARFFDNEAEARAWLSGLIASASASPSELALLAKQRSSTNAG